MTKTSKIEAAPAPAPAPAEAPTGPYDMTDLRLQVQTTVEIDAQTMADYIATAVATMHGKLHPSDPLTSITQCNVTFHLDDVKAKAMSDPSRYDPNVTW